MVKPFISVIVTAHNRKEFILECLNSVLNQDLDTRFYEIIVVKNFEDHDIDTFIIENKIRLVYTNTTNIGIKFFLGAKEARGSILSFLNDDDKFMSNKLSIIYNIFINTMDLLYYHNSFEKMDSKGKFLNQNIKLNNIIINTNNLNIKLIKRAISEYNTFNESCISIRKEIILRFSKEIKEVSGNQDTILFLLSLLNEGKIILDSKKLTLYRQSNSTSQFKNEDINTNMVKFYNLIDKRSKSYQAIIDLFKNESYFNIILCFYYSNLLQKYLFNNVNKSVIIKLLFKFLRCPLYSSFKTRIALIGLIIINLINKEIFYKYIARIIFNNY